MMNNPLFYNVIRFPETLGGDEDPHYITFRPQKVNYGSTKVHQNQAGFKYNKSNGKNKSNVGKGFFSQISDQIGGSITSIGDEAKNSLDAINDIFKQDSFSAAIGSLGKIVKGKIQIGDFLLSSGVITDKDNAFPQGSISLYLPENLQSQVQVDYNQANMGAVQSEIANQIGQNSADTLLGFAKENGVDIASAVISDLARNSQLVQNVSAKETGAVLNPFSYQIFNGVQHRTFSYKFNLVARSPSESKRIKEICDAFIFYSLPGRTNDPAGANFLEIPVQWQIDYYKQGTKLEFFDQPAACFLQSVNISYNDGANQQLHADGSPINVGLELGYVEITPRYRDTLSGNNDFYKKAKDFFTAVGQDEKDGKE